MTDQQEVPPVEEQQIELPPLTELEYIEIITGALIELKMYFVAFFMVYIIFKIVRWDAK